MLQLVCSYSHLDYKYMQLKIKQRLQFLLRNLVTRNGKTGKDSRMLASSAEILFDKVNLLTFMSYPLFGRREYDKREKERREKKEKTLFGREERINLMGFT